MFKHNHRKIIGVRGLGLRQGWRISRLVRKYVGGRRNRTPITVTEGTMPPTVEGEKWYHVTTVGTACREPSTHHRRPRNFTYVRSTEVIVVGSGWLYRHSPDYRNHVDRCLGRGYETPECVPPPKEILDEPSCLDTAG